MDSLLLFLSRLKVYLEGERGRKAQLARYLNVGPQNVSAWCRLERRRVPDGSNVLLVLIWLREQGEDILSYIPEKAGSEAILKRKPRGGAKDGGKATKAYQQYNDQPVITKKPIHKQTLSQATFSF